MPRPGRGHGAPSISLSDLGVKRVHVGDHYQFHDGKTFVSRERVESLRERAVSRAIREEIRAASEREAARLARHRERERARAPVPPERPARRLPAPPPPEVPPPRRAEAPPGFRPVPPRAPFKAEPLLREPTPKDPVILRGHFLRYRDRDSGRYVTQGLYDALPPKLRDGIKREMHVRTEWGELGERVKPLMRYLQMQMSRGLTWEDFDDGDRYRRDAVRLGLV